MKLIDILNKIANGEEVPKKIKCEDEIFTFNFNGQQYEKGICDMSDYLILDYDCLNDEVEIIEENKGIEKLDIYNCFQTMGVDKSGRLDINFQDITDKINEIIDFLNNGDKENE